MDYYIVLSSITFATWLKRLFIGDLSPISIVHTPKAIPVGGCSYSLNVDENKVENLLEIANKYNIRVIGVYKRIPNGEFVKTHSPKKQK